MNYRMCKIPHNPPHSYGDCIRACVASLVDRDDVPHTYLGHGAEQAWSDLRSYLKKLGKYLALFVVEGDVFEFMEINNPSIPYILLCRTENADHAVICKNGEIIHDPNTTPSEIVGEHSCGHWIVGIIGSI